MREFFSFSFARKSQYFIEEEVDHFSAAITVSCDSIWQTSASTASGDGLLSVLRKS